MLHIPPGRGDSDREAGDDVAQRHQQDQKKSHVRHARHDDQLDQGDNKHHQRQYMIDDSRSRTVSGPVNLDAQQRQPAGHGAKVMYALQGATDPPTFTLFVNRELPQTYLRYLERSIREAFEFGSTPIKLRVRMRSE